MRKHLLTALLAIATTALFATPALAHAHLKKADPPVGATVSPGPSSLHLEFSEGIELAFSKIAITMGDGMDITPASITLDPNDPAGVTVNLGYTLDPGTYDVTWHVVSVDTHKTQGHYEFTVKP